MVSEVCLGSMTWGIQNTQADANQQIDYALAQGINFIDTAEMYPVPPNKETQGDTERIIGRRSISRWQDCKPITSTYTSCTGLTERHRILLAIGQG